MTGITTRTETTEAGYSWWRAIVDLLFGQMPSSVERSSLWVVVLRDGEEIGRFAARHGFRADRFRKVVADAAESLEDEHFDEWLQDCLWRGEPEPPVA